jgi:ParB/RepB/Spo0J family partition protein
MQSIPRELIHPNEWNVNAFDPEHYPKLVESIRQKGFMEPLKVTLDPAREGHYLLVDGYHRWKAAGELGVRDLPCEVWDISPEEAKVRGLQLNYLRGQPVPDRLAGLVHDLNRTLPLEDLAAMLPWSVEQLRDSLTLLQLPADLQEQVEQQAAEQAAQAPIPVTVVMLPQEHHAFEEAMARAREEIGKGARRGQLWCHVCHEYLRTSAKSSEAPMPASGAAAVRLEAKACSDPN